MHLIQTEGEFKEMLAKERAIAFVCFEWSGQAKISEQVIKKWEHDWLNQGQYKSVSIHQISPDKTTFLEKWVSENARSDKEGMEGGFGSVLWLLDGKAVDFIRYAAKTGIENLSHLTEKNFGESRLDK